MGTTIAKDIGSANSRPCESSSQIHEGCFSLYPLRHTMTDIGEATPDALIEWLAQTARPITGAFHAL